MKIAKLARALPLLALPALVLAPEPSAAAPGISTSLLAKPAKPAKAKPAAKSPAKDKPSKKPAPAKDKPKSKTSRDKDRKKKATTVAQAGSNKGAVPMRPAPLPPLDGNTYDFEYDGSEAGHPERSFLGRSFIHTKAAVDPQRPLPIVVFLHGMNTEQIKYRWMGGGQEGDVRRIVSTLMESEQIEPVIVAGPSTIDAVTASNAILLWPGFDLDVFLDRTQERLKNLATIDRSRVIVAGHSGAGCNTRGGLTTALKSKTQVLAGLVIDTCLLVEEAVSMAQVRPSTNIVVSWQTISWDDRYFDDFRNAFKREVKKSPPPAGILRELDPQQPSMASPHDAMVGITLRKWLPHFLPGPAAPGDVAGKVVVGGAN
ncbi:MAG: hypothetical protein U0359_09715 [Byssovorax sp.]